MEYVITFYNQNNLIKHNFDFFMVSTINSFLALGGNSKTDSLRVFMFKTDIDKSKYDKHDFIKIIYIEEYYDNFVMHFNNEFDTHPEQLQRGDYLGIYFTTWIMQKLNIDFVIIENDIFLNKKPKFIFDFGIKKIQLIQGEIDEVGNIKTDSLILFCPKEMANHLLKIFISILNEFKLDSEALWKRFADKIDNKSFILNNVMKYMGKSYNKNDDVLIHRNNVVFPKEFTIFEQAEIENLFHKTVNWKLIEKFFDYDMFMYYSKKYTDELNKTSNIYNIDYDEKNSIQTRKAFKRIYSKWLNGSK